MQPGDMARAARSTLRPASLLCIPSPAFMGTIMADDTSEVPEVPGIKVAPGSSERAPFIYCDGVALYGVNNGAIQLELAANTLMPEGKGKGVRVAVLVTAHLRCSPTAAIGLRDAINKTLAMLEQGQSQAAAHMPGSKPN
jgi:hypothetical protein